MRVETQHAITLLRIVSVVGCRAPGPATSVTQLLRLGQVCLPTLQLLCQEFLLCDIHGGANKPLKDFAFNHGNTDTANVALLAVGSNNSFCYIAATMFRMHCFDGFRDGFAVLRMKRG